MIKINTGKSANDGIYPSTKMYSFPRRPLGQFSDVALSGGVPTIRPEGVRQPIPDEAAQYRARVKGC